MKSTIRLSCALGAVLIFSFLSASQAFAGFMPGKAQVVAGADSLRTDISSNRATNIGLVPTGIVSYRGGFIVVSDVWCRECKRDPRRLHDCLCIPRLEYIAPLTKKELTGWFSSLMDGSRQEPGRGSPYKATLKKPGELALESGAALLLKSEAGIQRLHLRTTDKFGVDVPIVEWVEDVIPPSKHPELGLPDTTDYRFSLSPNGKLILSFSADAKVYEIPAKNNEITKQNVKLLAGPESLVKPEGIAADRNANIYVADSGKKAVLKIDGERNVKTWLARESFESETFLPSGVSANADEIFVWGSDENPRRRARIYVASTADQSVRPVVGVQNKNEASAIDHNVDALKLGLPGAPAQIAFNEEGEMAIADQVFERVRLIKQSDPPKEDPISPSIKNKDGAADDSSAKAVDERDLDELVAELDKRREASKGKSDRHRKPAEPSRRKEREKTKKKLEVEKTDAVNNQESSESSDSDNVAPPVENEALATASQASDDYTVWETSGKGKRSKSATSQLTKEIEAPVAERKLKLNEDSSWQVLINNYLKHRFDGPSSVLGSFEAYWFLHWCKHGFEFAPKELSQIIKGEINNVVSPDFGEKVHAHFLIQKDVVRKLARWLLETEPSPTVRGWDWQLRMEGGLNCVLVISVYDTHKLFDSLPPEVQSELQKTAGRVGVDYESHKRLCGVYGVRLVIIWSKSPWGDADRAALSTIYPWGHRVPNVPRTCKKVKRALGARMAGRDSNRQASSFDGFNTGGSEQVLTPADTTQANIWEQRAQKIKAAEELARFEATAKELNSAIERQEQAAEKLDQATARQEAAATRLEAALAKIEEAKARFERAAKSCHMSKQPRT